MTSRDGARTSLWQGTSEEYIPRSESTSQNKYDVIIIGGGITGISTGLTLQQAGMKCIVLEANHLCYGTTGGTTAHINTLLDVPYKTIIKNFDLETASNIAEATRSAIDLIESRVRDLSIDCSFSECNAYLFAQDSKQDEELDSIADASKQAGLSCTWADKTGIAIPHTKVMKVAGQAKFHPVRYVHKLAEAFEDLEGVILENCQVTNVRSESDNFVTVESPKGNFQATYAIYATHIPPTINILHLRCAPYRSYAMAVRLKDNRYPEDLIYDMYDPYHYYRTQEIDGNNYLIVGGYDHKTGHSPNTEAPFLSLESHIRTYFDVDEVTNRWSSQYYEPADGLPYIGPFPGHSKNILVATGFGGNGITYGTVASQILKSIVLEKSHPLIDALSPKRIKPVASFKNFAVENLDVFKQLMHKLFMAPEAHEFVDVAPGEGKIFKVEGQSIGVYKDDTGSIHTVNATCTHMKCTVSWNLTEKSWDCPCHGARFSVDGKVLNGPADKDLEYTNLELISAIKS